jgi:WD40 repeat protein
MNKILVGEASGTIKVKLIREKMIKITGDHCFQLWDWNSGSDVMTWTEHEVGKPITSLQLITDFAGHLQTSGSVLCFVSTSKDGTEKIWQVLLEEKERRRSRQWSGNKRPASWADSSDSENSQAAASPRHKRNSSCRHTFSLHLPAAILCCSVHPSKKWVATGDSAAVLKVSQI